MDENGLYGRIDSFYEAMQKNNPAQCRLAEEGLARLSDKLGADMRSARAYLFYRMSLECPGYGRCQPEKKVLVVSDIGIQHARFLARELLHSHGDDQCLRISCVRYLDAEREIASQDYDMVISTVPCQCFPEDRQILTNDCPTREDLTAVQEALKRE